MKLNFLKNGKLNFSFFYCHNNERSLGGEDEIAVESGPNRRLPMCQKHLEPGGPTGIFQGK